MATNTNAAQGKSSTWLAGESKKVRDAYDTKQNTGKKK